MSGDSNRPGTIGLVRFLLDDRPVVFVKDEFANRHFLQGIDPLYWSYQAAVHGEHLGAEDLAERHRASAALRVAYSQGVETLFALLAAFVQVPSYPLAWVLMYRNDQLRSVVSKIDSGVSVPSPLKAEPSWDSIAAAVFQFVEEPTRSAITVGFAQFWTHLAGDFLDPSFEPEYNNLKHGMRSRVGGFSVAMGRQTTPGERAPAENMSFVGGAEYGSTFWMPPQRVRPHRFTFELTKSVARGWVVDQFTSALELVAMSIRNVVSRSLIIDGVARSEVPKFEWPLDPAAYVHPWERRPSISELTFGQSVDLGNWQEPAPEEIERIYQRETKGPDEEGRDEEK
jgi:hypothetical protein